MQKLFNNVFGVLLTAIILSLLSVPASAALMAKLKITLGDNQSINPGDMEILDESGTLEKLELEQLPYGGTPLVPDDTMFFHSRDQVYMRFRGDKSAVATLSEIMHSRRSSLSARLSNGQLMVTRVYPSVTPNTGPSIPPMTVREKFKIGESIGSTLEEINVELPNHRIRTLKVEGNLFTDTEKGPTFYMSPQSLDLGEYGELSSMGVRVRPISEHADVLEANGVRRLHIGWHTAFRIQFFMKNMRVEIPEQYRGSFKDEILLPSIMLTSSASTAACTGLFETPPEKNH